MTWIQVVAVSLASSVLAAVLVVLWFDGATAHCGAGRSDGGRYHAGTAWHYAAEAPAGRCGHRLGADRLGHLDVLLRRVPAELELTPAQRPAWSDLTESLRTAQETLRGSCGVSADGEDSLTRLDRAEAGLRAAQAALAELRPAYAAFLATLGAAQRDTLERWLARPGIASHSAVGG